MTSSDLGFGIVTCQRFGTAAVADDDFVQRGFAQEGRRLAAEDRVRGADINAAGFMRMHDIDRADN